MNLAVIGSRNFDDYSLLERELNTMIDFIKLRHKVQKVNIISGGAKGADSLAEKYFNENKSIRNDLGELIIYPAQWKKYGKSAGYRRNKIIIDEANIIIAFWDGISKGTKQGIDLAKLFEKPIKIIKYKEI